MGFVMAHVAVRRIGNSSGVIFPQSLLSQLGVKIGDKFELVLEEGKIVLTSVPKMPRAGWAQAAQALAEAGEDALVWPEFANADDSELQW